MQYSGAMYKDVLLVDIANLYYRFFRRFPFYQQVCH